MMILQLETCKNNVSIFLIYDGVHIFVVFSFQTAGEK